MSWVGGYTSEDVGEPSLRIDAVHFGGDDQAVHGRSAPPAAIRAAEQPGLSAKRDTSQAALGGIV